VTLVREVCIPGVGPLFDQLLDAQPHARDRVQRAAGLAARSLSANGDSRAFQSAVLAYFDALIGQDEHACVFEKTLNGGSGLLKDLPAIGKIFEAVRAAVTKPPGLLGNVTVVLTALTSYRPPVSVAVTRFQRPAGQVTSRNWPAAAGTLVGTKPWPPGPESSVEGMPSVRRSVAFTWVWPLKRRKYWSTTVEFRKA
jgi:hypothetical protein